MKQDDKPTIELYMYSLNQEFPVAKGHATYLKRYSELKPDLRGEVSLNAAVESQVYQVGGRGIDLPKNLPNDWSVQWLENQWIENHTKAAGMGIREDFDPLRNAVVREEEFGGIVFEPNTDRVYKLNHSAFRLFQQMREQSLSGRGVKEMRFDEFDEDAVEQFAGAMRAAGLLPS